MKKEWKFFKENYKKFGIFADWQGNSVLINLFPLYLYPRPICWYSRNFDTNKISHNLFFSPVALFYPVKPSKNLILVEGVLDAFCLIKHGFGGNVGIMMSAGLSGMDIEMVAKLYHKGFFSRIIHIPDNDKTGISAFMYMRHKFANLGVTLLTWIPPRGKDLGDLLLSETEDAVDIKTVVDVFHD